MRAHVVKEGVIIDTIETPSLSIFDMVVIDTSNGGDIGWEVIDGIPIQPSIPEIQPVEGEQ